MRIADPSALELGIPSHEKRHRELSHAAIHHRRVGYPDSGGAQSLRYWSGRTWTE
ncbi:hypothetical protein DIJ64_06050 [Mycobacterium leprae]|uniref:DUF2510 domain-containing protein n=1 Tax=Mycobacterium leprae TaxID=1769 RepID=A0AAD0KUK5_MYCLR|nr:hypothetical protein DIJ64_06050 [Mycobacterium leprae]